MATTEEIEAFLSAFTNCEYIHMVPRRDKKNENTLSELGMTPEQRESALRDLTVDDYWSGPELDPETGKIDIWKFCAPVWDREMYIKVKTYRPPGYDISGKCISFHFPEHPMRERRKS